MVCPQGSCTWDNRGHEHDYCLGAEARARALEPGPEHDHFAGTEDGAQAGLEPGQCGDSAAIFTSSLAGTFLEDSFDDRYRGKNIGPTRIEGQVGQHLRRFRFGQAAIHRSIEVIGNLRDLV